MFQTFLAERKDKTVARRYGGCENEYIPLAFNGRSGLASGNKEVSVAHAERNDEKEQRTLSSVGRFEQENNSTEKDFFILKKI